MSKPALLYVITRPDRGGAQSHVLDLIRSFRAEYAIHLAVGFSGPLTRAAQETGCDIHLVPALVRGISPHQDVAAVVELTSLLRKIQPALVHAHSSKAGILGRLAAKLARIPAIFTVHGWAFSEGISSRHRWIALAMERMAAGWTKRLICVSEYDDRLAARYKIGRPEQRRVVKPGLEPQAPQATPGNPGTVSLAMVARFNEQKDHETLMHAISYLKLGTARLSLIGDGETRMTCEQLARHLGIDPYVQFWGNRSDVPSLLSNSHVFVLSTNWEGLPISILEAIRAGLPVVATAVAGIPEVVIEGQTGFLVPRKDRSALAQALQRLIEDHQLRADMGQRAREQFLANFTLDRMLQQIEQIYQEVLGHDHHARR